MITWENIKHNNVKELKAYREYNKQFNILNEDFLNIYNKSNYFKRFFLRKNAKILKYNNCIAGFIWVNSFKGIKCNINQFYTLPNFNLVSITSSIWSIFKKASSVTYRCEDNNINEEFLTKFHFKKHNSILEMDLSLNDYRLAENYFLQDDISIEYFKEGIHEQIRCNVQNEIFQCENRVPLNIDDILEDEKQNYYIEGGGVFLKFKEEYIGYGQLILEDDYLTIVNFGVIPNRRRKGYGKILLDQLVKLAKIIAPEEGLLKIKVYSHNEIAVNLYKAYGFKVNKKISTWNIKNSIF